jgi:hypothetical protein
MIELKDKDEVSQSDFVTTQESIDCPSPVVKLEI